MLRGFNMEMAEGSHVTDVYSELAANAAADVNGIAYAMSKAASIASSSGMSFENTAAFITNMIETTQEAPENIGTALKSIIARFQELKDNVAGTTESEFNDLDYNKVDKALKSVGISIKDATGQFRDLDDVFLELGKKWGGLSRNTQRYIATIAAGSRQQSRFLALMSDYDRTMELVNVATNSAGRADEQFAKYADTVEYRVNQLKNVWEEFRTSIVKSDTVKGFLEIAKTIVSFINETTNSYGKLIPTLITVFGLFKKIKSVIPTAKNITQAFLKAYNSSEVQSKVKLNADEAASKIKGAGHESADYAYQKIKQAFVESMPSGKGGIANSYVPRGNSQSSRPGLSGPATNPVASESNSASLSRFGRIRQSLTGLPTKAGNLLKTIGPVITQASTAITAGLMISAYLKQDYKESQERDKEILSSAAKGITQEYNIASYKAAESQTKTLEEAKDTIEKLSNQTYLGEKDTTDLQESIDLLREKYPEFIASYDENTGKISLLNEKLDEAIATQKENNQNLLAYQLGQIGMARGNSYAEIRNRLLDNSYTTGGLGEAVNEHAPDIMTGEVIGGILAGGLIETAITTASTAAATTATTAAIGTAAFPIIGTIIGGAVGVLAATLTAAYSENTTTLQEFKDQISLLDNSTQEQIFKEVNKNYGESIATFDEFSTFLDNNADKMGEIANTTSDILTVIQDRVNEEDAIKAVQQALVGDSYGKDGGKITEQEAELLHGLPTTDFEKSSLISIYQREMAEGYDSPWYSLGIYDPDVATSSNFSGTQKALEALGQFAWFKRAMENFSDLEEIPGNFKDLSDFDQKRFAEFEESWNQIVPTSGIPDIDDYYKKISEGLLAMAYGRAAQKAADENKRLLDTVFNDNSGLFDEVREWEDATNQINGLTLEQFKQQKDLMLEKISKHTWSPDSKMNDEIVDWLSRIITGITQTNEVKENSSTDIERKLVPKIAKLKEYFADNFIDSISVEAQMALEKVMSKAISNENWDKIAKIMQDTFDAIPTGLSGKSRLDLVNYITETLNPESFDVTQLDTYKEKITGMTGSVEAASKMVDGLWNAYASNNISTVQHSFEDLTKSIDNSTKSFKNNLSSWSTFISVWKDSLSTTGMKAEQILSLAESPQALALGTDGSIDLSKGLDLYARNLMSSLSSIDEQIRDAEKSGDTAQVNELDRKRWAMIAAANASLEALPKTITDEGEKYDKALDKAKKAYRKALSDIEKAEKSLRDAIKNQNEAYNGSDTWVAQISGTFDLDNEIKKLNDEMDVYNDKLKDAKDLNDALILSSQKNINLHQQDADSRIKQLEYQEADTALLKNINNLAATYGVTDPFNIAQLYNDSVPDLIRDRITKMLETHESYNEEIRKLEKEDIERMQNYQNEQKALLDKRVKFLQDGANIMKEAAEKEVKNLKDKYDSMKEADDDYLDALEDAIGRQRDLRDREKESNELAQQEKKLSLLSRDTSGTNEKEQLKLEKDLEDDRQKHLDNTVDDIIKELKRQSEEREKERQAVIEATEAINEATNWVQQFSEISANWTTQQEVLDWFNSTSPDLVNRAPEEIQQMQNNLTDSWTEQLPYLAFSQEQFTGFTQATLDEILTQQENYHTTLQEMEDRTTQKAIEDLEELQLNADNARESAEDALETAKETLENAKTDLDDAQIAWDNYLKSTEGLTEGFMNDTVQMYKDSIDEMLKKNAEVGLNAARQQIEEQREKRGTPSKADQLLRQYQELDSDIARNEFAKSAAAQGYSYVNGQFALNEKGMANYSKAYNESKKATDAYKSISDSAAKEAYKKNLLANGYIYEDGMMKNQQLVELESFENPALGLYNTAKSLGESMKEQYDSNEFSATKTWERAATNMSDVYSMNSFDFLSGKIFKVTDSTGKVRYTDEEGAKILFADGYTTEKYERGVNKFIPYKFATGGLVPYTGPAWVDGTPSKPEAFLSPEDTRRIGEAARLLALSPFFNSSQIPATSSVGDTSIEININVEQISDDYDVDRLVNRVHQDILDAARPMGTPVILRKN